MCLLDNHAFCIPPMTLLTGTSHFFGLQTTLHCWSTLNLSVFALLVPVRFEPSHAAGVLENAGASSSGTLAVGCHPEITAGRNSSPLSPVQSLSRPPALPLWAKLIHSVVNLFRPRQVVSSSLSWIGKQTRTSDWSVLFIVHRTQRGWFSSWIEHWTFCQRRGIGFCTRRSAEASVCVAGHPLVSIDKTCMQGSALKFTGLADIVMDHWTIFDRLTLCSPPTRKVPLNWQFFGVHRRLTSLTDSCTVRKKDNPISWHVCFIVGGVVPWWASLMMSVLFMMIESLDSQEFALRRRAMQIEVPLHTSVWMSRCVSNRKSSTVRDCWTKMKLVQRSTQ